MSFYPETARRFFLLTGLALLFPALGIAILQQNPETAATRKLPSRLLNPGSTVAQAHKHLKAGRDDQAAVLLKQAMAIAPYLSATWALWGHLLELQHGLTTALPFYDHALQLDRFSRRNVEFVAPRLHAAGWMDVHQLTALALRLDSLVLARLLPQTPAADWPQQYKDALGRSGTHLLFHAGLDHWLIALEAENVGMTLDAETRGPILAGICRARAPMCTALATACRQQTDPCRNGVQITPVVANHVSQALLVENQPEAAIWWARTAANAHPGKASVRHLVNILEATSNHAEARQLRRLHPALKRP